MSHPTDGPGQTGELLMAVARRVRHEHVASLSGWGITPSQSRALRVVATRPDGMRPSVLADELRIAPRSATEVADALEDRGWVRRVADPADRRATLLVVTTEGVDLLGEIDRTRRSAGERVLGVLTADQRRTLDDVLRVVLQHGATEEGR